MPTGKDHIVYWDTCVFLAWMNDEKRPAGDMEGLGKIATLVERAEVILITSTITRAEILQSKTPSEAMKKYDTLMRRSNVVPQNVDLPIAKLTSELMDFYINSDFELLTPDAIHLATALHYNAEEFHTFDGVDPNQKPRNKRYTKCGLLSLNGNVAGRPLKVVRPSAEQYELNLTSRTSEGSEFQLTSPLGDDAQGILQLSSGEPVSEISKVVPIDKGGKPDAKTGDEHKTDPSHPAPVRGSDEGRAQGEATREGPQKAKARHEDGLGMDGPES
jgi:predicted nucleic acid-binding protein